MKNTLLYGVTQENGDQDVYANRQKIGRIKVKKGGYYYLPLRGPRSPVLETRENVKSWIEMGWKAKPESEVRDDD